MTVLLWIAWAILVFGTLSGLVNLGINATKPLRDRNTGVLVITSVINLFVVIVFFLELINR